MAIDLNTLTSPATSGDILQEVNTTADFLEPCPVLRNLSRGSNKGGDAKQDVALNQPKALPLDADGKGYLYVSGVSGNYASVPDATNLDGFDDFTFQVDNLYLPDWSPSAQVTPIAKGSSWQFSVHTSGSLRLDLSGVSSAFSDPTGLADKTTASIRAVRAGSVLTFFYSLNGGETWVSVPYNYGGGSGTLTNDPLPLAIGAANVSSTTLGKISGAKVWNNATQSGSPVLDVDFTATKIRHNDTKFVCDSGQVVTVNQSGNDPSTIIKRSVLRFDGVNDGLRGLFANNINGGYMFAAFSVLGDGGESYGRVFSTSLAGTGNDYDGAGAAFSLRNASTANLSSIASGGTVNIQNDMFDDARGDILHVVKIENESQKSDVNNASFLTNNRATAINSNEFNIAFDNASSSSACIDLEYLALFSVDSVPDEATASKIRDYINGRGANPIFTLIDSAGYYFFDPQKATFTGNFTNFGGGNRLDGYITGSDNGDTDVRSNLTLIQETGNDQPSTDGYTITFHDNAEHLEFKNGVSQNLSGWQICGTSLGTFAYRVQGAVTELNLLGNAGGAAYRQSGDLYGVILLPESATGADIEEARKLLINRGASDGVSGTSLNQFWRGRTDILEFNSVNTTGVTDMSRAWQDAGLTKFALLDTSSVTNLSSAFANCNLASFPLIDCSSITQMGYAFYGNNFSDFPAIQAPLCSNFSGAWNQCSALTSFPAGAQLGTEANNVNFTSAWQSSGLTSFPALDLSAGTNFNQAFYQAISLEEFGQCDFSNGSFFDLCWYYCSALTSFPSMQLPSATSLNSTWMGCSSLTDFGKLEAPNVTVFRFTWSGSGITTIEDGTLLGTSASSVDFTSAFKNCIGLTTLPSNLNLSKGDDFQTAFQNCQSLVNFPANAFDTMGTPQDYCFLNTWLDNNALSAASVENILVSINTSGQSAPSTGPEITIKYNTATGTPAYSTLASLKSKGWVIVVNGVTL